MAYRWFWLVGFVMSVPTAGWAQPVDVTVRALDGLQYAPAQLTVAPGAEVRLTLENPSAMMHNWVLVAPGEREAVVQAALAMGPEGPERDYVPDSDAVLAAVGVIAPGSTGEVRFTAPTAPGVYPFVCTYPGHGVVMYGALYVTETPASVPDVASDPNLPPSDLIAEAASPHPFPLDYPLLYRTFVPDASPAAIVVSLNGDLSYCWDAGYSHLQYAWTGGFVDNTAHWSGNGKYLTELVGTRFYQQQAGFPFRLGDAAQEPQVEFVGYRLTDRLPTFRYRVGEVLIEETITAGAAPRSLVRTFTVEGLEEPLAFVTDAADGVRYEASAGTWDGPRLHLDADAARQFSITMTAEGE